VRLTGRVIAVTRGEKAGGDPLAARLRALGAAVLEVPSIALAPPADPAPLDAALRGLGDFAWVAFASANAVTRTLERARALGVALPASHPRLACVGPATAEALAAGWRAPDLVPEDHRGEALAAALGPLARGARILVPRAEDGRPELVDGLARAGAQVVAPVAYRTVPAPPEALAPLADALGRAAVHAIAFASPSAVRSVVTAIGAARLAEVPLAAIGPTTAAALGEAGLRAAIVPARSTAGHLAEAIAERIG